MLSVQKVRGEVMSSKLDHAMMNMNLNLEEEDEPFDLPDLPEFCSNEQNALSIIGRILNPDHHNILDVVLDMPRKWKIYDRVKGIALSNEKFQFIFKHEIDLKEVLKKGGSKLQSMGSCNGEMGGKTTTRLSSIYPSVGSYQEHSGESLYTSYYYGSVRVCRTGD